MIVLYRAVKPHELADIQKTGHLINRGDAEGKYFSTTAEGATAYARQAVNAFGDPPYTLVTTRVSRSVLLPVMFAEVDRDITAVLIPDILLSRLTPKIENYMPIP